MELLRNFMKKWKVREFCLHRMDLMGVSSNKVSIFLSQNCSHDLHFIYFTANNQLIILFTELSELKLMLIDVFVSCLWNQKLGKKVTKCEEKVIKFWKTEVLGVLFKTIPWKFLLIVILFVQYHAKSLHF